MEDTIKIDNGRFLFTALNGLIFLFTASLLLSILLPDGVNSEYALRASVTSLVGALILAVWLRIGGATLPRAKRLPLGDFFALKYLLFALIPIVPITGYLSLNSDVLTTLEMVLILFGFFLTSVVAVVLVPLVLDLSEKPQYLIAVFSAALYSLFEMAALTRANAWTGIGDFRVQLPVLLIVTAIMLALAHLGTRFLAIAAVVLLLTQLIPVDSSDEILSNNQEVPFRYSGELSALAADFQGTLPNVYVLVYESYTAPETLLSYGIDNSAHDEILRGKGFIVKDGVWSVDIASHYSISKVYSPFGSEISSENMVISGGGPYWDFLDQSGYQKIGAFPAGYFFEVDGETGFDEVYPKEGETAAPSLVYGIIRGELDSHLSYTDMTVSNYVKSKREFLRRENSTPLFFHTHNTLPGHSQNSGQCLSNEVETYKERLAEANVEMIGDLAAIGSKLEDSIVFIFGDHGPYLTLNCAWPSKLSPSEIDRQAIQDRAGVYFAVHWPKSLSEMPPINIIQDILPSLISGVYGASELAEKLKWPQKSIEGRFGEVTVEDGTIFGGPNDGQRLFLTPTF